MADFVDSTAFNYEQGQRARKLFAAVVLAALDDMMRQGRHWGFTVLVFLCILLNFYIAWPVCLFSILYFLCLWPSRGQGRFGRRFAAFAASGVLAAGLSFFFLLPVLLEVQESKGGLFDFTFSLTPQFNLLQLPYRLFFGNFFWNDVTNGLPNIYCGVVLVPLVLLYFCGNAPRREKLGFAALLAALAGSFWVKGVDQIWHGMKQPVWFPYRYSFLFSAVVILLAGILLVLGSIPWTVLFLPLIWVPFIISCLAISFFLGAVSTFIRDIQHIVGILTVAMFFVTPVFYSSDRVPSYLRWLLYVNPVAYAAENTRKVCVHGMIPDWNSWLLYTGIALALLYLSTCWFQVIRKRFPDVI